MQITVPYKFNPRPYQLPLLRALDNGCKRVIQRWHRRSGKDLTAFNYMIKRAVQEVGQYYYILPTYTQAKKVIWDNIDNDGFKMLDHIPKELLVKSNDTELKIELRNGSIIQLIGSDNYNAIMGTNPKGCVFSEYSLQDPSAWQYIRPILAANGGWAIFNFTPRGENHAFELEQLAESNPEQWYVSALTVDDTNALSREILDQEKKEMLQLTGNDALYQQEYRVSYTAPVEGSYYGSQLIKAEEEGRITNVPWEPGLPVHTWWDLGIDDSMTIGFVQVLGKERRFIDYLEGTGEGIDYYIREMKNKPYVYGEHYAPHDIEVREMTRESLDGRAITRKEYAKSLGINFKVTQNIGLPDGINSARSILNSCWFDREKCRRLLNGLKSYQKEWDDKNKVYKNHPLHNFASHPADMFRYFAVSYRPQKDLNDLISQFPTERMY